MKALFVLVLALAFGAVACSPLAPDSDPLNPTAVPDVHGPAHGVFGPFGNSYPSR